MFESVRPGARIAILPLGDGTAPISRVTSEMLVWAAGEAGMRAESRPFRGFPVQDIDLLFAADDWVLDTLATTSGGPGSDPFARLVKGVNDGLIMLFYLKERDDLEELGYEEFFERLGLSFMGGCR